MGENSAEPSGRKGFLQARYVVPAIGFLVGGILMAWKTSTQVQVNLTANHLEFTIDPLAPQTVRLFDSLSFQLVAIQDFESVVLQPQALKRADPRRYDVERECYPETEETWESLPVQPEMILHPMKEKTPQVTFGWVGMSGCAGAGTPPSPPTEVQSPLKVSQGAKVEMELQGDARVLFIKITGDNPRLFFALPPEAEMIVDGAQLDGQTQEPLRSEDTVNYRLQATEENGLVEVSAGSAPLVVSLILRQDQSTHVLNQYPIPVAALDFTRVDGGQWVTTLVADGTIEYPAYPEIRIRSFQENDFLILDEFEGFYIRSIKVDSEQKGFDLVLKGTAGEIRTGLPNLTTDQRLSMFDKVNPMIQKLWK